MLYFVRHGETDWNAQKRFQSTTDVPLNARGMAQARCLASELQRRGTAFAEIRCSPLQRAAVTAQILGVALGIEPATDQRLTEMPFGDWEGMFESELLAQFGKQFTVWRESHYTTAPPGGQSMADVAERIRPAVDELCIGAIASNVIVVAHQAIMMAVKALLTGDYTVTSAISYKQNNDEVDVWDVSTLKRCEFFKFECT
ncbi:MAG: histidine phosphatase family protein [bacterium]|nr:histidine phosphatase family protein [bacterium]